MTPNEQKFCALIPRLAVRLDLTTQQALALFGVIAAGMVSFEVSQGADAEDMTENVIKVFTNNLLSARAQLAKVLQ